MTIIDISESANKGKEEYIKCPKCHSELIRLLIFELNILVYLSSSENIDIVCK